MRIAGCVTEEGQESRSRLASMLGTSSETLNAVLLSTLSLGTSRQDPILPYRNVVILIDGNITNASFLFTLAKGFDAKAKEHLSQALVLLYLHLGKAFIHHLEGSFSLILYDIAKFELFLFNDPLGTQALYWAKNRNGLFFANDLKSLIASNAIQQTLNFEALSYYLMLGSIPLEQSPLLGIYRLLPGYYLHFRKEADLEIIPYFSFATLLKEKKTTLTPPPSPKPCPSFAPLTIQDLYDFVFKLAEPIATPEATYAYLLCKSHQQQGTAVEFTTFSPSWFFQLLPEIAELKGKTHPLIDKAFSFLLSCVDKRRFFSHLRSCYTHPYHALFLQKRSFFSNAEIKALNSSQFFPIDLDLFLSRFPALETFGPTPPSLVYLFFKTELFSSELLSQSKLCNAFGFKRHFLQEHNFLALSNKEKMLPFSYDTLFTPKHSREKLPLTEELFQQLIHLLLKGSLLEGGAIHKKWLLEHSVISNPCIQSQIYLLAILEIWIQEFVEKSPKAIAKKLFEERK